MGHGRQSVEGQWVVGAHHGGGGRDGVGGDDGGGVDRVDGGGGSGFLAGLHNGGGGGRDIEGDGDGSGLAVVRDGGAEAVFLVGGVLHNADAAIGISHSVGAPDHVAVARLLQVFGRVKQEEEQICDDD